MWFVYSQLFIYSNSGIFKIYGALACMHSSFIIYNYYFNPESSTKPTEERSPEECQHCIMRKTVAGCKNAPAKNNRGQSRSEPELRDIIHKVMHANQTPSSTKGQDA